MLERSRLAFGVLPLLALKVVACSEPEEIVADTASATIHRVPGTSIASPNVDASATYLSVRRIDTLQAVGAIPGQLGALARRVDGIIASQPADGRVSVSELLQIEKPGFIETLFPEERAQLPALWKLLETTDDPATPVTLPALVTMDVVDVSTPAGSPIEPESLDIASLPARLQRTAQRLELTQDSDSDPTTITKADIAAAIASPGPYTPAEIKDLETILEIFLERAGTSLAARVQVPEPVSTTATLATWGGATLGFAQRIEYSEQRRHTRFGSSTDGALDVRIEARLVREARITLAGDQKLVVLDETRETESVVTGGTTLKTEGGVSTIEVWSGGVRTGIFRAELPAIATVDEKTDLSRYADYAFVTPSGATLIRNVASATVQRSSSSTTWSAQFTYDTATRPPSGGVDTQALGMIATPKAPVTPGRYEVDVPTIGKMQIDLYPEGVMKVTRPGWEPQRARLYVWSYAKLDAQFGDRLRALYDPYTNALSIFFDGQRRLFEGPLTAAQRTG
jgi:hypothetical protein